MLEPMEDSSAAAKRNLAKVQRMLEITSKKKNSLALRDFRSALQECLKVEAATNMKILGFKLASRVPSCTTEEIWQLLQEATVTELSGSQNASVLLYSLPFFEILPLQNVLMFLMASEKEPMNKLRGVLTHEKTEVKVVAIDSLSKVTIQAYRFISQKSLNSFCFESHEARICCQQDVLSMIIDVWKIIFQSLFSNQVEVAGTAFHAMKNLFSTNELIQQVLFEPNCNKHNVNELISSVFKESFPRIHSIIASAKRLSMKFQVPAMQWISMLLYMMMDRSGATCPSVSVPYLEIDVYSDNQKQAEGEEEDDEEQASTERVRMDQLSSELVETWMFGSIENVSLSQAWTIGKSIYLLLSHSLLEFTRIKVASTLVSCLIAQAYHHQKHQQEIRIQVNQLLIQTSRWMISSDCIQWFVRIIEAISTIEEKEQRLDLIHTYLNTIFFRIFQKKEFDFFSNICGCDFFQNSFSSKMSPLSNPSEIFQSLVHALCFSSTTFLNCYETESQITQLMMLKSFFSILSPKTVARQSNKNSYNLIAYMTLLTHHFQQMYTKKRVAFQESIVFFHQEVLQNAYPKLFASEMRLQLVWMALKLFGCYKVLPLESIVQLLHQEIMALSNDELDTNTKNSDTAALFDNGKLGETKSTSTKQVTLATGLVLVECLKEVLRLQPAMKPHVLQLQELALQMLPSSSFSTLRLIIQESMMNGVESSSKTCLISQELFHPSYIFAPRQTIENKVDNLPTSSHSQQQEVVVTGSADPFCLRVAYTQHPVHQELITLEVSCCNITNLPMSDFEIQVRYIGPMKLVDASNDLKIRMNGTLAPRGTFRGEKKFQFQKFSCATFYFQVVFYETDNTGGGGGGGGDDGTVMIPIRLGVTEPFVVNFNALFCLPDKQFQTPAFYQSTWQCAEASKTFGIISTMKSDEVPKNGQAPLSFGKKITQAIRGRVAAIPELLVDTPHYVHIGLVTKTRWGDDIAVSLTLCSSAAPPTDAFGGQSNSFTPQWTGMVEVRGSSATIKEFSKYQSEFLSIFSGKLLQLEAVKAPVNTISIESTASSGTLPVVSTPTPTANSGNSFGFSSAPSTPTSFGSSTFNRSNINNNNGGFGNVDLSTPKLPGNSNTFGGDFDFGSQASNNTTTTTEEIRAPSTSTQAFSTNWDSTF